MKINSNITNCVYDDTILENGRKKNKFGPVASLPPVSDSISFTGSGSIRTLMSKTFSKAGDFVRRNITHGIDIEYNNQSKIFDALKDNFGTTFEKCINDIDAYNNLMKNSKNVLSYTIKDDKIMFHKTPFSLNVLGNIAELLLGTILDGGILARKGINKASKMLGTDLGDSSLAKTSFVKFLNKTLDNHILKKNAKDAFYRLSGVFEQAHDGVMNSSLKDVTKNIQNLAGNSVASASKKVGQYNTKTERAWNRLGTGFVSALFAATDFYNISMIQNNDPEKATISGRKRFWQDMRRQGLTAGITFVVLGALQGKVNKSPYFAVASLTAVTLVSEILSRVMGKNALTPLSPEDAKKVAERRELEKNKLKNSKLSEKSDKTESLYLSKDSLSALLSATSKRQNLNTSTLNKKEVFKAFNVKELTPNIAEPSFKSNEEPKVENEEKKPSFVLKLLKGAGIGIAGGVAISLGIGFLRTRNVFGINDGIKAVSKGYNDFIKKITRRDVKIEKDQVDGFLNYLNENGFEKQSEKLRECIKDKKVVNSFYNMGQVESKGKSTLVRFLTYPINRTASLLKWWNNLIKTVLTGETMPKPNGKLTTEKAVEFIERYSKKYKNAIQSQPKSTLKPLIEGLNDFDSPDLKENLLGLVKDLENNTSNLRGAALDKIKEMSETYRYTNTPRDNKALEKLIQAYEANINSNNPELEKLTGDLQKAFTRHFSEANSQNKNTTIAMLSRIFITIVSGYFFINDYRNEVLIESKGKDIDRANATGKERFGHKIANFLLNSMFMDLFNTTLEPLYLSSVPGATAVAMATEVTNESAVRASICTPKKKMNREELIEYENERLNDKGLKGKYYRLFMKLTGKKPLSSKAKKTN